ncbi:MAG: polysaccharide ABC transporter ATP-binding protein [Bacteroidales bacterium]
MTTSDSHAAPAPTLAGDEDIAIRLDGVCKYYPLFSGPGAAAFHGSGLEKLLPTALRSKPKLHRALDGINLTIRKGEKIGILGRNGAGKTTMLKLITGNYRPTHGEVTVNGEVKALMSMGLGFHPDFSGLENIRSSLQYNGLPADQLEAAIADVVDFVELGDFIDQPVKTYSLGMQARLQFACATAIRPEIVIVDEVMGAGDTYFNAKCADRIRRLTESGCTFLLVSHNMAQIIQYCDRAIWIRDGRITMDGAATDVVSAYEVYMERESARHLSHAAHTPAGHDRYTMELADGRQVHRWPGRRGVKINRLAIQDSPTDTLRLTTGDPLSFAFELIGEEDGTFVCNYMITFWRVDSRRVARLEAPLDEFTLKQGEVRPVRVEVDHLLLGAGEYHVSFSVYDRKNFDDTLSNESRYDVLARALKLHVDSPERPSPVFVYPAKWSDGSAVPAMQRGQE